MENGDNFNAQRAKGDEGQRYVDSLFDRVFTPIFCYSKPLDLLDKNQPEICDKLICWEDTVIICEVKNWKFDGDHEKYHKKTVERAITQIQGAERKLLLSERDVEIGHPYRGRHRFPKENFSKVIRLAINLGEGEEFYPLVGETSRNGFVSVINKDTLEVMLHELDTPKDLLQYLHERERLLQVTNVDGKRNFLLSGREADLLSLYLKNGREFPVSLYDESMIIVALDLDGSWEKFQSLPEVHGRKIANDASYFVDELIHNEILPMEGSEPIARFLLSFNRLERRAIGMAFEKAIREFSLTAVPGFTFRRELPFGDQTLICLLYHSSASSEIREELVRLALYRTAIERDYNMHEILVIGTHEATEETVSSYQFHFAYDPKIERLEPDLEVQIRESCEILGWFTKTKSQEVRFHEYPMPPSKNHSLLRRTKEILSSIWKKIQFTFF